jgi:cytoskeletal protein CcmA (bactofilin family)
MAKNNIMPDTASPNQINAGTTIEGNIVCNGNLRIDGNLTGRIECKGKVVIGSTSRIEGELNCANADIMGSMKGNLYVTEKTSLKSTCVFEGDIYTESLAIEPGAKFNGNCQMGVPAKPKEMPLSAHKQEVAY